MNKRLLPIIIGLMILSSCKKDVIENIPIPECNCFIETADDTYTYPIRPGSEEWESFTSTEQMIEAIQVPNTILENMSTIGVYETCAENPLGLDLFITNQPQFFYDYSVATYNSWRELVSRNDVTSELIERYSIMCPDCEENNYSSFQGKGENIRDALVLIELILAQDEILSKASKSQCLFLGKLLSRNYEYKNSTNQSVFFQKFPVWIALRIMTKFNYAEYMNLEAEKVEVSTFNQAGILLTRVGSNYTAEVMLQDIMGKFGSFLESLEK